MNSFLKSVLIISSLFYGISMNSQKEEGFVDLVGNGIIFGKRDRNTIVNALESQYIFNNKIAINLAFRHYYSEVEYGKFFTLQNDGNLIENLTYDKNHDATYK